MFGTNQEVRHLLEDDQSSDSLKQAFDNTGKYARKGFLSCAFYFLGIYMICYAILPMDKFQNKGEASVRKEIKRLN